MPVVFTANTKVPSALPSRARTESQASLMLSFMSSGYQEGPPPLFPLLAPNPILRFSARRRLGPGTFRGNPCPIIHGRQRRRAGRAQDRLALRRGLEQDDRRRARARLRALPLERLQPLRADARGGRG